MVGESTSANLALAAGNMSSYMHESAVALHLFLPKGFDQTDCHVLQQVPQHTDKAS